MHALPQADGSVTLRAPAKLNLSLAVLDRRPDGYHDIESLMVPVTLADTVTVRRAATPGIRLAVRFGGRLGGSALARDVPADASNLVVRAATALAEAAGVASGLDVELVKEIPSGSGLGGGSSDAAATLMAAARAWGIAWPRQRLAEIAASIGSDVPFFLAGTAAIAGGRGERIEPAADIPPLAAVIVRPAASLSTPAVYAACRPDPGCRGEAARLAAALAAGRFSGAIPWMHNALEEPARRLCSDVEQALAALRRAGGVCPRLTGSGSACFTLARSAVEARGIAARLSAQRHPDGTRRWPGVFAVRIALAAAARRPAVEVA
jgi:4-diphosphocytidyl-2-C-methyl-D-erythritol kinase